MLNLWTANSSAQSLSCPSPAGAPEGVPFSTNWSNNLPTGQKIIPVVVHLIGNLPCALTQAQVEIAIQQLNADFDSQNLDWDIEFRLAKFAPDGRCTNGISVHCELYQTSDFKTLTRWPNQNYFNIWVVAAVNNDPDILDAGVLLIGSRAYWIGMNDNLIRKNNYLNLTYGNESVGDNSNVLATTGLRYLCNENQNNSPYDFNVRYGQGVRTVQGEVVPIGLSLKRIPAGNLFSHVNLPESDIRNSASNNIRYIYHFGVPETPQTFTLSSVFPEITDFEKQCESIYCDPPCRSEEQINQAKQAIITAKTDYNAVYASYMQQPNGTNAAAQKGSISGLQAIMQDNAFDVLQHIVATEGSLTDYRYWLGYLDAYETDLALAKSYIGTGE